MTARCWIMGATLSLLICCDAHSDSLKVVWPRIAQSYFTDEVATMTLTLPGARRPVSYVISDYYGQVQFRSSIMLGENQPATLRVGPFGAGYYNLKFSWDTGSRWDAFAVLPRPYEDPGDYSIFAACPGNGSTDEILKILAQMGVRLVRQTVPWPPFEPARGTWRMELLQDWYDMASRQGIQMMLILGYTPKFLGEKPANAGDDVWANNAAFTWHPREPNEYAEYLDRVTGFAAGKSIMWPSTRVAPVGVPRRAMPWADSFEMWNEADICFYMGDWNRYMDLLRMSYGAARQRLPDAKMVYGGSTGNFTAMCMIASGSGRYCFDEMALHTGGDVEEALRVWYAGAQQIPWCVGAPRETWHTECYAQGRRGTIDYRTYKETPADLQRCYITLKAWREAAFFRSGCLGGLLGYPDDWAPGTNLVKAMNGNMIPTPLYPAFAATRKLLSDAVEVGPVNLGDKITAHLFLKHGIPMLTAWSDDGANASIRVARWAWRVTPFGRPYPLGGTTSYPARLTPQPLVILGADEYGYFAEAVRRRFDLLTQTPYATLQVHSACWVWYANPMQQDLQELLGTTAYDRLNAAITVVENDLRQAPARAPQTLLAAQNVCMAITSELVALCPAGQEVPVKIANLIWRLARMEEWLGEIADDRSGQWKNLEVPSAEVDALRAEITHARATVAGRHPDAVLPVGQYLLDRCRWTLWRLEQVRRRGTYTALRHKVQTALLLDRAEQPVVLRVVPLVDFTTGRQFRKACMLEPAREHTLSVWAYNTLDRQASGTLRMKLPACWSPAQVTVPFDAAPGQPSEITPVTVTLPADPTPWLKTTTFTMDGLLNITLPSSLSDSPMLEVSGTLDNGALIPTMTYFINVGRWLDSPGTGGGASLASARASAATAAQLAGNDGLALPPAVRDLQLRSIRREMEALNQRPARAQAMR